MATVECGNSNIQFFEGNDCSQDNLGCVPYLEAGYDLEGGNGPIKNDEARSCRLVNVTPGTVKLYNSPSGRNRDDWTEIQILQSLSSYDIDSFDVPVENAQVKVIPQGSKLDGKVSYIEVSPKN